MKVKELNSVILTSDDSDEQAFIKIFNRFYSSLYCYSKKITGCRQEAEDITLCALQSLFERRNTFQSESQIKAFLYIAARNQCLNYLKYQKRSKKKYSEYAQIIADRSSFHNRYDMMDDLTNAVLIAVDKLPKECRKILKMLYYEELKPTEVAAILQISVRTVYNQKMTGINVLRQRSLPEYLPYT